MRVTTALLADYANVTREGKLNVLGIFTQVFTNTLPAVHPAMQLVLMLEGAYAESGREQAIEIRLMAPSGKDVFKMEGTFVVSGGAPGGRIRSNQILAINGLPFSEWGGHLLYVYLNGHQEAELALEVARPPTPLEEQPRLPGT